MLSGVSLIGEGERPRFDLSAHEDRFRRHLEALTSSVSSVDAATADGFFYASEMVDLIDPLNLVLADNRIDFSELESLGLEGLKRLVASMPTRRVSMHMHRQWAKNTSLRARRSDLNDWANVGMATAYCDVVVTEKQFADLVSRDGFRERARVISDLRELPELLA